MEPGGSANRQPIIDLATSIILNLLDYKPEYEQALYLTPEVISQQPRKIDPAKPVGLAPELAAGWVTAEPLTFTAPYPYGTIKAMLDKEWQDNQFRWRETPFLAVEPGISESVYTVRAVWRESRKIIQRQPGQVIIAPHGEAKTRVDVILLKGKPLTRTQARVMLVLVMAINLIAVLEIAVLLILVMIEFLIVINIRTDSRKAEQQFIKMLRQVIPLE